MPYFACGNSTSTISAPSEPKFSIEASTAFRTSSSRPSPNQARGTPSRLPLISAVKVEAYSGTGTSAEVESKVSRPAMTCKTSAMSLLDRPNRPMLSSDEAKATSPYRDMRPYVGLRPTIPQSDAGWRTDPPVSEPRETCTTPDATATAEPPELPPGTLLVSQGLRTGP